MNARGGRTGEVALSIKIGGRSPGVDVLEHWVTMEKTLRIIATSIAVIEVRDVILW